MITYRHSSSRLAPLALLLLALLVGARNSSADSTARPMPIGARAVPWAYYITAMHQRIHPRFTGATLPAAVTGKNPVVATKLSIVLDADGGLYRLTVAQPSGVPAFDAIALASVKAAAPFSAPPALLQSSDGHVYLDWQFRSDVLSCATSGVDPHMFALSSDVDASAKELPPQHWIASWAASPQRAARPLRLNGQTLRQIVHLSLGGDRIRVRLSNLYGATPLQLRSVHVARQERDAIIVGGSDRALTFGGARGITLLPGAQVTSDPVDVHAAAGANLVVSLHADGVVELTTEHADALQTTYLSSVGPLAGDLSGVTDMPSARSVNSWYLLSGVDIEGPYSAKTVIALGDSITDGRNSTLNANHRWPDLLAGYLNAQQSPVSRAVINAGISGNGLRRAIIGEPVTERLQRDVLSQPGVGYVVLLAGVNDLIEPPSVTSPATSVAELEEAAQRVVAEAHRRGVKVIGGTLTPFNAHTLEDAPYEAKRQAFNQWIRQSASSSGAVAFAFDAVVDFDRALRDPAHPTDLLPAFDSGDHLHPNDAGYRAMADAVDLVSLLR